MRDVFFRRGSKAADLEFRDGSTDGLREIAILERVVSHKSAVASAVSGLASEVIDEPQDQADSDADDQTRHDGKIKCAVFAAVQDVTG